MAYAELLRELCGSWRLVRRVHAGSCGAQAPSDTALSVEYLPACMEGQATFTALPTGADASQVAALYRYREDGELITPGGEAFAFSRSYIYGAWEQGLEIRFDDIDQRQFERVALTAGPVGLKGAAAHLCGADTYRSRYHFVLPGSFSIVHAVEGPRKDYVIRSNYTRIVNAQTARHFNGASRAACRGQESAPARVP